MKVREIHLQNFQTHKQRVIEFSPDITTIRGATDKGKSAILRALRWVCQNNLGGEEFVREGAKGTEVKLVLDTGDVIARKKVTGGGVNAYVLNGEEFRAFGTGVPSGIADLLRLEDINFQGQHDSPFWFSETAGEVSRQLNAVIDLGIIDHALSQVASQVRTARERVSLCQERLEQAKSELEKLEPQRERVGDFESLSKSYENSLSISQDASRLGGILRDIETNQAGLLCERSSDLQGLLDKAKAVLRPKRNGQGLHSMIGEIESLQSITPPCPLGEVEEAFECWEGIVSSIADLSALIGRIESLERDNGLSCERVKRLEGRLHEFKGKTCPLCGNVIR